MIRLAMNKSFNQLLRPCSTLKSLAETVFDQTSKSVLMVTNSQYEIRRGSRMIRRKMTRLESDYEIDEDELNQVQSTPNEHFYPRLINRNPRNLEQLLFEPKPLGWELEATSRTFWNRIEFETSGKYLVARVIHHTGRTVLSVSSADESFQHFFKNKSDIVAAQHLATILARRCLESGINYVFSSFKEEDYKSQKLQAFVGKLRENGLALKEPEFILPRRSRDL